MLTPILLHISKRQRFLFFLEAAHATLALIAATMLLSLLSDCMGEQSALDDAIDVLEAANDYANDTICDCYTDLLYGGSRERCMAATAGPSLSTCETAAIDIYGADGILLVECLAGAFDVYGTCLSGCPGPEDSRVCLDAFIQVADTCSNEAPEGLVAELRACGEE